MDIIELVECVILYLYYLFHRKLFLHLASLLSDMIITMFNYGIVLLINMLLLWLHHAMYVRYFDYVLH